MRCNSFMHAHVPAMKHEKPARCFSAVRAPSTSSIDLSWRSHLRRFPLSRVYAADGLDTPEKSEGTSTKNCYTEPTCTASEATKVLQGVFECQRHQGSDGRLCD